MPSFYDDIQDSHREWAMKQAVFYIASAPTYGRHVNVSPKGLPAASFSILSKTQCAYVDATGSGCETLSHIQENGRVTVMFNSFGPSPRIMRFFCTGRVVEWEHEKARDYWLQKMGMGSHPLTGCRAIIVLDVFKTQISCGYGVPFLGLAPDEKDESKQAPVLKDRETMHQWAKTKIDTGKLYEYQLQWCSRSLDGLPGMRTRRKMPLLDDVKAYGKGSATGLWHHAGATFLVMVFSSFATIVALFFAGLLQVDQAKRNYIW